VSIAGKEDSNVVVQRLREFCRQNLARFKVPMSFEIVEADAQANTRAKKQRPR